MALRLNALPPSCEWSVPEVCDWLEILGLEKHKDKFAKEEISGAALFKLSHEELRQELGLPLGDSKLLMEELDAQRGYNEHKRLSQQPLVQQKGQLGVGESIHPKLREKLRTHTTQGQWRSEPLTEEELECWDYQASWLRCAVTGRAWPTDDKALIGMALYHQPRFIAPQELRRRQLEEDHAARKKKEALVAGPVEAEAPSWWQTAARPPPAEAQEATEDLDGWDVVLPKAGSSDAQHEQEQHQPRVGRNNKGEVGVGNEYDRSFEVYPVVEPPPKRNLAPLPVDGLHHLGWIEVMVGPVFERDAYNRGAVGKEKETLGYKQRGVVCLDRQYNGVNFQFYVQRHANSFARKICTSRLSFYIEEGHGARVFPDNILNQLSLLFYRSNAELQRRDGTVLQEKVATCIMRAVPKILLQTVLEVVQGTGFEQYCEHAVRLYLLVHHTAIKLVAFFPKAHQCIYDAVKAWIQNPFASQASFTPEEAMLAASLVSVPFSLLREPLVRRVLYDLQGPPSASSATLLRQNRELLERLTFVQSFFEGGPGKLGVQELEKKYTRCAGSLPKAEREQLLAAVREATVESCEDWWRMAGMDGVFADDEQCAAHLQALREHVLGHAAAWSKVEVERPKAVPRAACVGAEELGGLASQRAPAFQSASAKRQQHSDQQRQAREAARMLHEGYPTLVNGKLDPHTCLYCQESFRSKGALFRHLHKMIAPERMVDGWHHAHLTARVDAAMLATAPFCCPAACCRSTFESAEALRVHLVQMGTPLPETGVQALPAASASETSAEEPEAAEPAPLEEAPPAEEEVEEAAPVDPHSHLGTCFRCPRSRNTLFAQCGHIVACDACAEALTTCPVCSKDIALRIKVCWS